MSYTNRKFTWDFNSLKRYNRLYSAIYDVSANNSGATFASLDALLSDENLDTLIPTSVRKGGMSIKFVRTSDNKYVQYRLMSDSFNTTSANWQELKDDTVLDLTEGTAYYGGTIVGTSTIPEVILVNNYRSLKIPVTSGEKYSISARGGNDARLYYIYDAQGVLTRVANSLQDTTNAPLLVTIGETEQTLIINCLNAYPSYIRYNNYFDTIFRHTEEIRKINDTDIPSIQGNITDINAAIAKNEEIASSIEWTNNRFIRASDGAIVSTSSINKVGKVSIGGCKRVSFNWSIRAGGSYEKLTWKIEDKNGNILSQSENCASNIFDTGSVDITIPNGAETLYISSDPDVVVQQTCVVYKTLDSRVTYLENENTANKQVIAGIDNEITDIQGNITNIENTIAGNKVLNIENIGVQAFMNVRYNDADYSYTRLSYAISGAGNHPAFQQPNGRTIDTPIDVSYVSRSLDIADNAGYANKRTISLDLVSSTYTITNLEGNKLYYFRVYYNGSTSNIISSGMFRTNGTVRELLIGATTDNPDGAYIANVRDIAGWKTCDGKQMRYGCLIRGRELNHDTDGTLVSYISQSGINELKALGVSAELDLRGGDYNESALGNDVAYANIPTDLFFLKLNIYVNPVGRLNAFKACLQQIITWISAGKGIYVHCEGGCDRTGFLFALIQGICGVSENDINHDYELSNRDRSREYYTIAKGDHYDGDFKFAIEYIKGLLEYNGNIYVYYRGNYYDPTASISNFTPVPISDATLLAALNALPFGTFKECWHRLMKIGGVDMSERDMQKLEQLLCS